MNNLYSRRDGVVTGVDTRRGMVEIKVANEHGTQSSIYLPVTAFVGGVVRRVPHYGDPVVVSFDGDKAVGARTVKRF